MGPLAGTRVVEMAGIGPVPFCGMLLSDMGASVCRIDRLAPSGLGSPVPSRFAILSRGRRSLALDLKKPAAVEIVLKLVREADALIEGFRPGVMERLGLGPAECMAANPRLVYGRMTGWGQDGPYAGRAGHDINYIAVSGALHSIGVPDAPPVPPLNLVGDYGGGALYLCIGVLAAMLDARTSGRGQVVDAAMLDGALSLMSSVYARLAAGRWVEERGANLSDGGAPFYNVYETSDGGFISIGAIEEKFYRRLVELVGLADDPDVSGRQSDRQAWAAMKVRFAAVFKTRTRAEWMTLLANEDVCAAPVLRPSEALDDPQVRMRRSLVEREGVVQPAPAPRFGRTPSEIQGGPSVPGAETELILRELGLSEAELSALRQDGVIGAPAVGAGTVG